MSAMIWLLIGEMGLGLVLIAWRPAWVRRVLESLWAVAWAVETGKRTYRTQRQEARLGAMDQDKHRHGKPYVVAEDRGRVETVMSGLTSLGLRRKDSEKVAREVCRQHPETADTVFLMTEAIRRATGPGAGKVS